MKDATDNTTLTREAPPPVPWPKQVIAKRLRVEGTLVLPDIGGDIGWNVRVTDPELPWAAVYMRAHEITLGHDPVIFCLSQVRTEIDQTLGASPQALLLDGAWWEAALDAVLEFCAYNCGRFDDACEEGGAEFGYAYGWDDGAVRVDQVRVTNANAAEA